MALPPLLNPLDMTQVNAEIDRLRKEAKENAKAAQKASAKKQPKKP
jgi:hypothetical protein